MRVGTCPQVDGCAGDRYAEVCAHETGAGFHGIIGANFWTGACRFVFIALRYYWITSKGYRLRPWRSPYIRWRMETFFGREAESAHDARGFFRLMWRERARMRRFLLWVGERWHEQARRRSSRS